ncbi:MAG: protein tyrosine kinase modulator [Blastocatellia bacterium]|jgi:polysaccharide chain length determinant protein (PEP-CTERM system associated)|nr:protein tyrosine kinase modulator [Blastocatellia bacterium]MDX6303969.1 protein tyrosine kinase modulator [Blastocatellia bacterium]
MSVEFRPRKLGEYADIARKRKWLILLPTVAIGLSIAYAVYRLPDVYESVTLIVVKPSTLPNTVVPAVAEETLTRELTSISQVVTSRSSLQPLMEKYDLFHEERLRGEPMELLIDQMRKQIKVEVNTTRNEITNGFNITYRGRDPKSTQVVATELASKYIDEQTKGTVNAGTSAKHFIEEQVQTAKAELDASDNQRLTYLQQNMNNLPSQSQALVGRLTGLHEEQKALIAEQGRQRDLGAAYRSQLADITKSYEQEIALSAENTTDPKTTQAWAELVRRRSELEAAQQSLLTQYKPKHPDVVSNQLQIDSVKRSQDQMIDDWKTRIEERKQKLTNLTDPRILSLRTQIAMVDSDSDRTQKLLSETNGQIADLTERINAIPMAEVGLQAIDREYQTKKLNYDNLLAQQQKIDVGADAAKDFQGGGIQVVDPANLPERPVAPKRFALTAAGFGIGMALGFLLAIAAELRRLFTIQTTEDAKHYTGLTVLASIPELLTAAEARAIPRRHKLTMAAGVAAAFITMPALAFVLRLTHVLEKFLL